MGELFQTIRLAVPLAVGLAGNNLLGLVDTLFAGRLDEVALSATGVGNSITFLATVLAMGMVMGLEPIVAQARGAGDAVLARRTLSEGLILASLLALPAFGLMFLLAQISLPLVGIDPESEASVYEYMLGRAGSVLPFLWFTALRGYLQAANKASAVLWSTLAANLINAPLNGVFALGDDALIAVGLPAIGLPAMGIYGLGLASTLVSFVQAAVLWNVLRRMPRIEGVGRAENAGVLKIFKLGLPIGLHLAAEVGIFGAVTVIAGGMGPIIGGAHQLALQVSSFTFTLCLGISQATTVRVGGAIGARNGPGVRASGLSGMSLGLMVMTVSALILSLWPEAIARLITDNPEVIAVAVPLLRIAGVFQLFDGLQAVAAGALRGASDTRAAFLLALVGYWGVGLPAALALAFWAKWGAAGLWWGLTSGIVVASLSLTVRFLRFARRFEDDLRRAT